MPRSVRWYARELERRERDWAAERRELIDTICHLAGRPKITERPKGLAEPDIEPYQPSPEQHPVD